jgi:two-component system, sensor histidine kinase ChiS
MKTFGVLPTNAFTSNAMQVGSVLEFLLLSFALADRIKRLQAEATRNAERAREATERVLVEHERTNAELERLGKLKDEFLANTSHELRTPLHGILGLTESVLSAEPGLGAASRKRLGMVVASGRRLASLVNDILDFSKLRNQELALRERAIELRSAVDMTLSVLAPGADAKGLALVNEVEAGLVVQADEGRLQQILTNLVGNAVKFTSSGSVVVRAEETSGDAGGRVVVSVRDTGIGIAPEAHARIFESFEQADGSTSRAFGGTGLGLAVTKKLVELHGGRVALRSAPGRGSTFSFDVARAEGAPGAERVHGRDESGGESMLLRAAPSEGSDDASVAFPSVSAVAASGHATGHLLVADDDPVNLEVLRAQLEPGGYSVTIARDGAEAVAALETLPQVDGVLLDVMMPNMTGVEAAVRMREAHPHGTLPILMLTAKSRPEDAVVGLRAGASDYVGKPFHREELLRRVDAHVRALKTARTFRRFVPEDFLALLGVEGFDALRAGLGERREVTILFSDVRAFTARSERLGPERTFRFINACLERFEPVVRRHGGFVDKFIGDAIMAIFPGEGPSAVHAAAELHRSIDGFEASFPEDAAPVAIGVGVHRGPVILGTIGAANRMEVTAIGDAVNVAARLESLTKSLGAGALVSKEVLDGEPHDVRRVGAVHVKGRTAAVELFELLACCSSDQEREQKRGMNVRSQRGLLAYAERDMACARETFASCVRDAPLDRVAALYLERSAAFAVSGVPEGFDGCLDGV